MNSDLNFAHWTLELARKDGISMGWFEERRFEWCQIASRFTKDIIEGSAIIICSDLQKKWFCEYAIQTINANTARPLIPIVSLESMLPNDTTFDLMLVEDMLNVAFNNKYIIWYIGYANNKLVEFAKNHQSNFIWAFDGNLQTAFNLKSDDINSDIQLLQLFKILNKTIDAMMFDEIDDGYGI
ncbi:HobA family DNA replication regulator [Helicobacter sp. MIT 99-5507]|uniref:HobA family DNA replication regulator n=1 Tax=Helicobacter sp. MIT 99-5507 TaxID=152489 RepID=UPI000E1E497D|nr:HobA family DNA replication regulator [Helicobacter sp. MIT 99-5507]RDU57847.1 hypothetical protein CQA42_02790 [Helicobacter sp. MIT 99-5507]